MDSGEPGVELKGRVKSVRTEEVTAVTRGGGPARETRRSWFAEYDPEGKQTEETFYDAPGNPSRRNTFAYDEAGRPTEQVSYGAAGAELLRKRFVNGLPAEAVEYEPDGSPRGRTLYLHDPKDRLVYAARFNPDGSLFERREARFDREGRRSEERLLPQHRGRRDIGFHVATSRGVRVGVSAEGAFVFGARYGAGNDPTRAAFYNRAGELIKTYLFVYDARGLLAEVGEYAGPAFLEGGGGMWLPRPASLALVSLKAAYAHAARGDLRQSLRGVLKDPLVQRTLYSYDPAGGPKSERRYLFGERVLLVERTRGERGELLRESRRGAGGVPLRVRDFSWEFDGRGNWVARRTTESLHGPGGSTTRVVTAVVRSIEYFE